MLISPRRQIQPKKIKELVQTLRYQTCQKENIDTNNIAELENYNLAYLCSLFSSLFPHLYPCPPNPNEVK